VQIIAENKDEPHFTPQKLELEIDEETPGIIVTSQTIIVEDRDAVSKETLMCKTLMYPCMYLRMYE
jgi:hypothetical protein